MLAHQMLDNIDWSSMLLVLAIVGQQIQIWVADKERKRIGKTHDLNMMAIAAELRKQAKGGCCGGCEKENE